MTIRYQINPRYCLGFNPGRPDPTIATHVLSIVLRVRCDPASRVQLVSVVQPGQQITDDKQIDVVLYGGPHATPAVDIGSFWFTPDCNWMFAGADLRDSMIYLPLVRREPTSRQLIEGIIEL